MEITRKKRILRAVYFLIFIVFLLLVSSSYGQSHSCTNRMQPFSDDIINSFISDLKSINDSLVWAKDNQACKDIMFTRTAFSRTLGNNYLVRIKSYEISKLFDTKSNSWFTIERFSFQRSDDAHRFETALRKEMLDNKGYYRLAVESNVLFRFFKKNDEFIFIFASEKHMDEYSTLLDGLKNRFLNNK